MRPAFAEKIAATRSEKSIATRKYCVSRQMSHSISNDWHYPFVTDAVDKGIEMPAER
jgi:hypothetical protein